MPRLREAPHETRYTKEDDKGVIRQARHCSDQCIDQRRYHKESRCGSQQPIQALQEASACRRRKPKRSVFSLFAFHLLSSLELTRHGCFEGLQKHTQRSTFERQVSTFERQVSSDRHRQFRNLCSESACCEFC